VEKDQLFNVYSNNSLRFSAGGVQVATLSFNVSLLSGDRYLLYTGLSTYTFAGAYCYTYGCHHGPPHSFSRAFAAVDVGTAGHGAWLLSMKVV
jgi:hypothetical protein